MWSRHKFSPSPLRLFSFLLFLPLKFASLPLFFNLLLCFGSDQSHTSSYLFLNSANCYALTPFCSGIGSSPLASNRKVFCMSYPSISTDFFKSFYVPY